MFPWIFYNNNLIVQCFIWAFVGKEKNHRLKSYIYLQERNFLSSEIKVVNVQVQTHKCAVL